MTLLSTDGKQSGATTAGTSTGSYLVPRTLYSTLIKTVRKNLVFRALAAKIIGPGSIPGSSIDINLDDTNTMDIRIIGEGSEIIIDQASQTSFNMKPQKWGVALRITREMLEDSKWNLLTHNVKVAGKRFAEKETELIITALDGANATTAGGAAISIANITESMYDLESNDYVPTEILIGDEILQDLRNIDTFVEANKVGNTEMLTRGFLGTIYGLNVVRFSTNAAPSTTYAKYAYVIDRSEAYGIAIKRDITMEQVVMPTYDMQGAVLTNRIAVALLRSKAVSKITTS